MKNVLLLGLLLSSATIYAEHHGQHGMENMHSHEGHLHNEMVNGKTLEVDAQRFRSLGAAPERTWVTGNIKFDIEIPQDLIRSPRES